MRMTNSEGRIIEADGDYAINAARRMGYAPLSEKPKVAEQVKPEPAPQQPKPAAKKTVAKKTTTRRTPVKKTTK